MIPFLEKNPFESSDLLKTLLLKWERMKSIQLFMVNDSLDSMRIVNKMPTRTCILRTGYTERIELPLHTYFVTWTIHAYFKIKGFEK